MPLCGMFLSIFRAMKGNQNCVEINWKPEISIDALLDKNGYVARIFLFFFSLSSEQLIMLFLLILHDLISHSFLSIIISYSIQHFPNVFRNNHVNCLEIRYLSSSLDIDLNRYRLTATYSWQHINQ